MYAWRLRNLLFSGKIGKKKPRKNNKLLEDNSERKMQFQFQCCFIFFLLCTLNEAFSFTEISHIRFAFISYFSFLTIHLTQAPNLLLFWSLMMLMLLLFLLYLCVHKISFFFFCIEKRICKSESWILMLQRSNGDNERWKMYC